MDERLAKIDTELDEKARQLKCFFLSQTSRYVIVTQLNELLKEQNKLLKEKLEILTHGKS